MDYEEANVFWGVDDGHFLINKIFVSDIYLSVLYHFVISTCWGQFLNNCDNYTYLL